MGYIAAQFVALTTLKRVKGGQLVGKLITLFAALAAALTVAVSPASAVFFGTEDDGAHPYVGVIRSSTTKAITCGAAVGR
jgi:hypothetical protein